MTDGQNFFDQPVRQKLMTYNNIPDIATGQGDAYTTGCLLDKNYFINYNKMMAINLSKKQTVGVDKKNIINYFCSTNSNIFHS